MQFNLDLIFEYFRKYFNTNAYKLQKLIQNKIISAPLECTLIHIILILKVIDF